MQGEIIEGGLPCCLQVCMWNVVGVGCLLKVSHLRAGEEEEQDDRASLSPPLHGCSSTFVGLVQVELATQERVGGVGSKQDWDLGQAGYLTGDLLLSHLRLT